MIAATQNAEARTGPSDRTKELEGAGVVLTGSATTAFAAVACAEITKPHFLSSVSVSRDFWNNSLFLHEMR